MDLFVVAGASPARVAAGCVAALLGLALLIFNRGVTAAFVAGQREGIGALLGDRRRASDAIHTSQAFMTAARIFVGVIAVFFVVVGIGMTFTSGH
jgi:hypothetical protein